MSDYTTQMGAAKQGIITPQMKIVAEKEHRGRIKKTDCKRRSHYPVQ